MPATCRSTPSRKSVWTVGSSAGFRDTPGARPATRAAGCFTAAGYDRRVRQELASLQVLAGRRLGSPAARPSASSEPVNRPAVVRGGDGGLSEPPVEKHRELLHWRTEWGCRSPYRARPGVGMPRDSGRNRPFEFGNGPRPWGFRSHRAGPGGGIAQPGRDRVKRRREPRRAIAEQSGRLNREVRSVSSRRRPVLGWSADT